MVVTVKVPCVRGPPVDKSELNQETCFASVGSIAKTPAGGLGLIVVA